MFRTGWLSSSLANCWNEDETSNKSITDVVMLDRASNVQLGGEIMKTHYPKLTVLSGVEYTLSTFYDDIPKLPIANQITLYHKSIYNIFGSRIFHKQHYIFKSKS